MINLRVRETIQVPEGGLPDFENPDDWANTTHMGHFSRKELYNSPDIQNPTTVP